jgi:hypothetical protein
MERFWSYSSEKNAFTPIETAPLSVFPTIVDAVQKIVYCRRCHRWEYITGFSKNVLRSQCGSYYRGPFVPNNTIFNYGYNVDYRNGRYFIEILMQESSVGYRRLLNASYELDLAKKILYRDGKALVDSEDMNVSLCDDISKEILGRLAEEYKAKYGIKPTIMSGMKGFNVIVGYMLSPFNVNFFKISQFWGLNPYNADFTSLSSGDTPDAENEMFLSMGIKPTKTVRKMYQQIPQSVICYAAAKDMGFSDVNVLQKSWSIPFYAFIKYLMISFAGGRISYTLRTEIKKFVTDMLAIASQKTVWNSLERTCACFADKNTRNFIITDGITTYALCSDQLAEQEKRDVLHEGFNEYTHDFLVRRLNRMNRIQEDIEKKEEDMTPFPIEDSFLALEYKAGDNRRKKKNKERQKGSEYEDVPDEDRYCFYVARNAYTLKVIGSEMHNCVGWGYARSIRERRATIVYAMYKKKYKICIEVDPQFGIRQAFGPSNSSLEGDAFDAYQEWCKEKKIRFSKVFNIQFAP